MNEIIKKDRLPGTTIQPIKLYLWLSTTIVHLAKRIFHTLLLASVLFSSTGIVLGKHHCQRMAQMDGQNAVSCADLGGCKKGCCSTEFQYFQSDQDQQQPQLGSLLPSPPLSVHFTSNWSTTVPLTDGQTLRRFAYRPPIVQRDIPAFFQIFRC